MQWLWDIRYIDAPVLRWRDADSNSENGLEETLYYCNDANMNVTALVSTSGTVVERYLYSPYGQPEIYNDSWTAVSWDNSKKNEILYCGYRWDPETGMYQVRNREYHPTAGRWVSRDPLPTRAGLNLSEYAISSPPNWMDPYGLREITIKVLATGEMPQTWPSDREVEKSLQKVLDTCFECCQDKVIAKIERTKQVVEKPEEVDSQLGLFPKPRPGSWCQGPQQSPPTEWRQQASSHRGSAVGEIAYTKGPRISISSTAADDQFTAGKVKRNEYGQTWGNILAHETLYHGMLGESDVILPDKDTPEMYTNTAPSSHVVQVPKEMCDKLKRLLQVKCEKPKDAK
ncbi:MAG: RHS repeat-associated core domain-containing protein [Planctomycetota bacterium]|nr:RHS repeat-associated core domain-containing protein [Planctomycetota bacterium]